MEVERRAISIKDHDLHIMMSTMLVANNEASIRMEKSIEKLVESLNAHEAVNSACRAKFLEAIPDGDAHRRYHEDVIKRMEANTALWQDVQKSVAKWGIIGIIAFVAVAIWHAVKHTLHVN